MTKHERIASVPHTLPRLCNVNTVARELDCGKSKVYKMIAAGILKEVTVEGMVRVPREELEAYISRCKKNSGLADTEASSSPSGDEEETSSEAHSGLRRNRILGRMHSEKSTG
jgi:excisionase family DNA binding protein